MSSQRLMTGRQKTAQRMAARRAFTLIEILMVVAIIGVLMSAFGVVLSSSIRKAREAATVALIQKIDGLLDERLKGFDRATKSRDFQRVIENRKYLLEHPVPPNTPIFGVSSKAIEAIARKDFYLQNFPQRYEDMVDQYAYPNTTTIAPNGIPDLIEFDPTLRPEDLNGNGVLDAGEDVNGNGKLDGYIHAKHDRATESAALLYFAVTRLQVFGVPPVGESEFGASELRDTEPNGGDGLLEFVDGWGNPLRFYRWPTRLLKPNGLFGPDGFPGGPGDDDGNGLVNDANEIGYSGSDDYRALNPINNAIPSVLNDPNTPYHLPRRDIAGLLIDGLPPMPSTYTVGGNVLRIRYDSVDEDPDDPYGLIVSEMQRLASSGINVLAAGGYPEGIYPTLDTYHTPLVVSVGADGVLGLYEPYVLADTNGDGVIEYGVLAQPIHNGTNPNDIPSSTVSALTDNLTNRNRRAGRGK